MSETFLTCEHGFRSGERCEVTRQIVPPAPSRGNECIVCGRDFVGESWSEDASLCWDCGPSCYGCTRLIADLRAEIASLRAALAQEER